MPTEHTELTTEQTELIEKLNCLEFETSQLNRAYQLWKSYVEHGKTPDWMTAAIRITYDDLIRSCLDTLTNPADAPKAFSAEQLAQLEAAARQISGILGGQSTTAEQPPELLPMTEPEWPGPPPQLAKTVWTGDPGPEMQVAFSPASNGNAISEQPTIQQSQQEKETSRHLWAKALVFDTTAPPPEELPPSPESLPMTQPEWSEPEPEMPAAISPTSNGHAISEQPASQQSQQEEERLRRLWANALVYDTTAPSPESLPMTEPDWPGPESKAPTASYSKEKKAKKEKKGKKEKKKDMPAAISPTSNGHAISEQPAIQQSHQEEERSRQLWAKALVYDPTLSEQPAIQHGQEKCNCRECARAREEAAEAELSRILGEESTTAEPSPELLPMTEPEWSGPEMPVAISPASTGHAISEQPAIQQDQLEEDRSRQLWAKALVYETTAPSPEVLPRSPELLPILEPEWSEPSPQHAKTGRAEDPKPEMPAAISPASNGDSISEQPAIQQGQREGETWVELAAIHIPATLANWLQGSSTSRLFLAASVVTLIVAGGAMGIYLATARPAILAAPNSAAARAAAGALAIPTGERAEFKFDPDLVVARLGRSFVLNAVLSRGSDISSMAVQIDYDANLLQFKGVSKGGFLVKDGQQVVLTQRDDPVTGVLRITAENPPGNPGISGDGPVFALSFQAKKKGNATVSIVPGTHDSQGRRLETAGAQVSVRVN